MTGPAGGDFRFFFAIYGKPEIRAEPRAEKGPERSREMEANFTAAGITQAGLCWARRSACSLQSAADAYIGAGDDGGNVLLSDSLVSRASHGDVSLSACCCQRQA